MSENHNNNIEVMTSHHDLTSVCICNVSVKQQWKTNIFDGK